jgi:hypothetical protein
VLLLQGAAYDAARAALVEPLHDAPEVVPLPPVPQPVPSWSQNVQSAVSAAARLPWSRLRQPCPAAPAGTGSQASLLDATLESFAIAAWLADWEALECESAALRKRFAAPVHRGAASAARLHLASISKVTGETWAALQAALETDLARDYDCGGARG